MPEPLREAAAAVQRSDEQQGNVWALEREVRELRDALRALIQWAEDLEARKPWKKRVY